MLCLDTLRGEDSTGVFVSRRFKDAQGKTSKVFKSLGTPWDFARTFAGENVFTVGMECIIGHNRAATKGVISVNNAHPFMYDNIVGVHNGTVYNHQTLEDGKDFNSDSAAIFHHMDKHGHRDTVKRLDGAFCLVWWNKADRTINLVRNNQRTMYYAMTENSKTLFWSSDGDFLALALKKFNIKVKKIELLPEGQFHSIEIPKYAVDEIKNIRISKAEFFTRPKTLLNHHQFNNTASNVTAGQTGGATKMLETMKTLVGQEIELRLLSIVKTSSSGPYLLMEPDNKRGHYCRVYADISNKWRKLAEADGSLILKGKPKRVVPNGLCPYMVIDQRGLSIAVKKPSNIVQLRNRPDQSLRRDQYGNYVSDKEFARLVKDGCYLCGDPIDHNDHLAVSWNRQGMCACPSCKLDEVLMGYFGDINHARH